MKNKKISIINLAVKFSGLTKGYERRA